MTTTNQPEHTVPGASYYAARKIVTAHKPADGWIIGNPVEALHPDEVIITNRARQMHQGQATKPAQQLG